MNCRDYTAEFEENRHVITEAAKSHLNDCPGCKKMSDEQMRVWQMIDALQRVDAPPTFDFKVKAKIAASKPTDFQPRFLPVLRYVLPLGIVVMLLGLVAFNTGYFSGSDSATQILATAPQTPLETAFTPINSFAGNQTAVANTINEAPTVSLANLSVEPTENSREKKNVADKLPSKPKTNSKNNSEDEGIGSRDLALTKSIEKFPVGVNPNQKVETSPNADNNSVITDEQLWEFFGIEVVSDKGNQKVVAVKQNTIAERSGVKVGDVIEAVNGEKLVGRPNRTGRIEGKTLTIRRGTEKIEITLKN